MEQGEVWWAQLPLPSGRRPVLILTRTPVIRHLTHVTIAPITRSVRPIPTHVRLSRLDGLHSECAANLDNIQTISRQILTEKIVRLTGARMDEIFAAIRAAFEIPR
jgi:mRNA interferase MazF